ncbi:MAG: hypothetical protein HUU16_22295 [Candidatus Omnitrophica bacterium]|nr:hypothetical protein [Candidatus Omnitrophota bacterium]
MRKLRVYVDTSVMGGCFDPEFSAASKALMEMIRTGEVVLIASDLLAIELSGAPPNIRDLVAGLPKANVETVSMNEETERLRDAYLRSGVVGQASASDAHHIAIATVHHADMIVSWNFKHIVHHDKIRGYNAVNLMENYHPIAIHSPPEVI